MISALVAVRHATCGRRATARLLIRGRQVQPKRLQQRAPPSTATCLYCSSSSLVRRFASFSSNAKNDSPIKNPSKITNNKRHSVSSLREVGEWVYAINQKAKLLEPFSLLGEPSFIPSPDEVATRQEVLQDTNNLVAAMVTAVENGKIQPSGKYGRELAALLVHILRLYSVSTIPLSADGGSENDGPSPSVFQECSSLLTLMKAWNLDCHAQHTHYSIMVAAQEGLWKEASDLFLQQIDPDVAGYTPIEISVSSPVGLFAIARNAQMHGQEGVVEQVFEAVLNMSLVSSQDQDKYVLAAGTALGLAGEWEALVSYLENSYNSSQLGQSLVAAAIHSCILCNRHDEAIQLFQKLVDGNLLASEFHWGGGENRTSPLCRDLAMRAMGHLGGASEEALELFQQTQEDGFTISVEALRGVIGACEQDQNWRASVDVLFSVLDNAAESRWTVHGDALDIAQVDNNPVPEISALFDSQKVAGQLLSSVMRSCNAAGEFGIALLCARLFEIAIPDSILSAQQEWLELSKDSDLRSIGPLELSLAPLVESFENDNEFVAATMVALCGFGCHHHAAAVYKLLRSSKNDGDSVTDKVSPDVEYIYHHACANLQADNDTHRSIAEAAHRHVYRLTRALHAIKSRSKELTQSQDKMIVSALSATIRACTLARQPDAGIMFAERLKLELSRLQHSAHSSGSMFSRNDNSVFSTEIMTVSDSLLAHTMLAYSASGRADAALDLFESMANLDNGDFKHWTLSCNAAISILADNKRMDEALVIFRKISDSTQNPSTFTVTARFLAADGRWAAVTDVYHLALERLSLSEEVGLLAMKAVAETALQDRIVALRGIVEKTAKVAGVPSSAWLENHYWMLKNSLGFTLARLLLWWNDPDTCHLDELELAIKNFEQRKASGLKAKHDVIRLIVSHAGSFNGARLSPARRDLARVPLAKDDWAKLLQQVVVEAHSLRGDSQFVDSVAKAFRNLCCNRECIEFVQDAASQGYVVGRVALQQACVAAESIGLDVEASNLRLLMTEANI